MEGMVACSRGTADSVRDASFQLSEVHAQATERYRVCECSWRPRASTRAVGRPTACQAKTPRPILAWCQMPSFVSAPSDSGNLDGNAQFLMHLYCMLLIAFQSSDASLADHSAAADEWPRYPLRIALGCTQG